MPRNTPTQQQGPLQPVPGSNNVQSTQNTQRPTPGQPQPQTGQTTIPFTPAQEAEHEIKTRHNILHHEVTLAIRIILVLCFASLSSLLVAPSLLLPKTAATTTYSEGACTAQPGDVNYPNTTTKPISVPADWSNAGRNEEDLILVQACTAAFASTYETFDATNVGSLASSVSMLSAAAKRRFYQGSGNTRANQREDPQWQAQAASIHLSQNAVLSNTPILQNVSPQGTQLFATLSVQLKVTITKDHTASSIEQKNLLVTLATVQSDPQNRSTGWQVTDWVEETD